MILRHEQIAFGRDLVKLLLFIESLGYEYVIGEVERPVEMQRIYVDTGRSKTMLSDHIHRTAADIHVFTTIGEYVQDEARLRPIGEYWESLSPKNRWGGNFDRDWSKVDNFKDRPHYERHL